MEFLYHGVVLTHFLSWALVLGLSVAGLRGGVPRGLMHAGLGALLTGVLLVGLREVNQAEVDHVKIGIKLALALLVAVLAWRAEKAADGRKLLAPLAGLTTVTMGVAVFL